MRLVDRRPAAREQVDLFLVQIDAGDVVTEKGQADTGGEPHVTSSDHTHPHAALPFVPPGGCPRSLHGNPSGPVPRITRILRRVASLPITLA
ncbi:hypothetical protein Adi01nite_71710 [Amorphoplanes digitatis]|nr:hypothetical protein Adi01nite_71710 [Actinoplanes digitatis]